MRKSGFLAKLFSATDGGDGRARRLAAMVGRDRGIRARAARQASPHIAELLESRVLLDGDHPGLPSIFNPAAGTLLSLDSTSNFGTDPQRGRALNGMGQQGVSGTIASNDPGDFFRFVMPSNPGRPTDFVTVLADTLTNPNGTALNSTLDSYVEVYRANSTNTGYTLIAAGANNGVLSSSSSAPTPDGWVGFVGTAGTTYYIRVRANPTPLAAGRTATGGYTLRVDAVTLALPVDTNFLPSTVDGDPNDQLPGGDSFGEGEIRGTIGFRQDDIVYRVESGAGEEWNSMATAGAMADDPAVLDTHLEVYDAGNSSGAVTTVASDIQAGRLTNAFTTWRSGKNSMFFVRVRSDELSATGKSTGDFTLNVDLAALNLVTDQTTRLSTPDRRDALTALPPSQAPFGASSRLYQFTAQGTGVSFITVVGQGVPAPVARRPNPLTPDGSYPALTDPAVGLYNDQGIRIAFNDDANGFSAQIVASLVGGQRYFILVEGFDRAQDGGIGVFIEAHYTFISTDDHVNSPPSTGLNFQNATPIVLGQPALPVDGDGNNLPDGNWVSSGSSRGRIYNTGDTDLFQFVPPVNMLGTYGGDDDNRGTALYVGGNFGAADRLNANNINGGGRAAPNVAIWDADDWWNAGPGDELNGLSPNALFGEPSAIDGPIRAFVQWDPDGDGTQFGTVLVAGGQFTLDGGGAGPQPANLALRQFAPALGRFVWRPLDDVFGALTDRVNALAVYDIDGTDGPLPPALIVGGRFTTFGGITVNNFFGLTFNGLGFDIQVFTDPVWGFTGIPGATSEVRALTVWDPPQPADPPDPDGAGPLPDPPQPADPPSQLAIGGSFTFNFMGDFDANAGDLETMTVNNLIGFGRSLADSTGSQFQMLGVGPVTVNVSYRTGVNGPVNALVQYDQPAAPGGGMDEPNKLIIGGQFTNAMGTAATNIAAYNNVPFDPAMNLVGQYEAFGTVPAAVNALTLWNRPTSMGGGGGNNLFIIAGGGVDGVNGFVSAAQGPAWAPLIAAPLNGPVRALGTMIDQEFDVAMGQQLIVGGDFDMIGAAEVGHIFRAVDQNNDMEPSLLLLKGGVSDLAPGEGGPTSVFAIAEFDDDVAGVWDRGERPSSRVQITVSPTVDSFLNAFIRIFDSNFNVIYTNDTISPPFPDPAGAIDPARTTGPGFNTQFVAPGMWGGEVYYIEVSGSGTGRYTISVSADALPPEDPDDGDGGYQDNKSQWTEVPNEGRFDIAPELVLNGSGDTRNFDFLTPNGLQPFQTYTGNITQGGVRRTAADYLASIEHINDTDLYQFRAAASGTVEIRLSTFGILDQATETFFTQHMPLLDGVDNTSPSSPFLFMFSQMDSQPQIKRYNSPLDGRLKVFNNDFELIGDNDDSRAVGGFADTYQFGTFTNTTIGSDGAALPHTFLQRDPRLVIEVTAGETYFVQVESAFRDLFALDPNLVDWRHAIGSYELVINNTQGTNGVDDYENAGPLTNSTAVPIDIASGDGAISGLIDNVPAGSFPNPDDTDLFRYIAVSRGGMTIQVQATGPSLRPIVTLFDANGIQVATNTGTLGGTATITRNVQQGERYFILVDGEGATEGTYKLTIDGPGLVDDHAKDGHWDRATPLALDAFLGQFTYRLPGQTFSGSIENAADSDLFIFRAEAYEIATVTVTALDPTFDPFVFVWEINNTADNPAQGITEYRIIAANDNGSGRNSVAQFSVTAGNDYYIVVYGADLNADFGRYNVVVSVTPTDDHPNFTSFPLATQLDLSTSFNPLTFTSSASANGRIEVSTDDDMFRFIAPATGSATVTVTTPGSGLAPNLFIYGASGNSLGMVAGTNGSATITFNVAANQQYFIQVRPGTAGPMQPDDTGTYTVSVSTAPIDDYANQGQFMSPDVGVISLNPTSGVGSLNGFIVPSTDTDLFRTTTLFAGSLRVRVTTDGSTFNPKLRVFRSDFTEITGASSNGDVASITFSVTGAGQVFYFLVLPNDGATGSSAVGAYVIEATNIVGGGPGPGPGPGPGADDHANAGEFGDASRINLDSRTGFGRIGGVINYGGDTDLFQFTPAASGRAGVQVKTPSGGLVDGRVKVFDRNFNIVSEDIAGVPGVTAIVSFNATAGTPQDVYYVLVEPIGGATGSYTVEVTSQPIVHYLYYPEGFSGATIDEFVPIVNPNSFAVQYQVFVRYESGAQRSDPIASGTIGPNSRGGITVSQKNGASLVQRGRPYALEIQSTGQLGATMSHYDFDVSVGESFTNQLSTTWTFAQVNKDRASFRDFIVFYNPSTSASANLTIDLFYENGARATFTQTVAALRRSGVNVDTDGRVPFNGRFGVRITSDIGIVAAVSSYNLANKGGDGLLGDFDGGATAGVIPNVSTGGGVSSSLAFLNTNTAPATVTVTASYARVDLPDLVRVITVQPGRQFSISLSDLGLINSQPAGIRYTSTLAVTAAVTQYQNGDGDTTNTATHAAREYIFGDLFINPAFAGVTYIERLGLFNPSATAIDVNVKFLFVDGTSANLVVNVAARNFGFVQIDQARQVLDRGRITAFSLDITSQTPIVASLTHYDLFLNGGWSTIGAPIGLTVPISTIV